MPTFTPPTWNVVPPVLPETHGPQRRLFSYYGPWPRGRSVLFVGGHYVIHDNPSTDDLAGLVEGLTWFQGGRRYTVDNAIAALLNADGFVTT